VSRLPLAPITARAARAGSLYPVLIRFELGEVAVQMFLAAMLINADHAPLENRVVSLNGIGIDFLAGSAVSVAILAARMVNSVMLRELIAKLRVSCGLIGHDVTFAVKIGANDRQNVSLGDRIWRLASANTGLMRPRRALQTSLPERPYPLHSSLRRWRRSDAK
jgi:hypothetical protein